MPFAIAAPASSFYLALTGVFASDQAGASGTWQQRAGTSSPNSNKASILSYPQSSPQRSYNTTQAHIGQGSWNLASAVAPTDSRTLFAAGPRLS